MSSKIDPLFRLNLTHLSFDFGGSDFFVISVFYTVN